MTGETIAGNVVIITRSAFDYPGMKVQAKGGVGHVELGKKTEYEGSLVISDRIDTGIGEFGIVSSASLYRRGMVTDNFETDSRRSTAIAAPVSRRATGRARPRTSCIA